MKGMRYHSFGGLLLQEDEISQPRPSPDQILVRSVASSINPADWKIGEGQLPLHD
jgi:NADPH:quinone reductase-like Zn-dependent oxidoreductase